MGETKINEASGCLQRSAGRLVLTHSQHEIVKDLADHECIRPIAIYGATTMCQDIGV